MNILQGVKGEIEEFGYIGIALEMKREPWSGDWWVLRDRHDNYIDSDYSRLALARRNGLKLQEVE